MKHKTTFIHNKKAFFSYEVQETLEAGIELFGHEVKSVKEGSGSLEGAYVQIKGGEAFLANARISPFQQLNTPKGYDQNRPRKLLLHKKEISKLSHIEAGKGQTIIPISLYNSAGRVKVEIAVAKGKKLHDKRESIKKRETAREIRREMKR
ncbi:MAG TPA: SsrA-binding protein SmpB [Candidatus Paceibacterota bacterium]